MQKSIKFKNIAIVRVKKSVYRIYYQYMIQHKRKRKPISLMTNSNLIDKRSIL